MTVVETSLDANPEIYIARQPIFGAEVDVVGYELLYRSSPLNAFDGEDSDLSTMEVLSSCLIDFGLDDLVGKKPAFINFTAKLLKSDFASMLPPKRVVIEILEDVAPDQEIIDACIHLKNLGYTIALDDFVETVEHRPLMALADIIKVDFKTTAPEERARIAKSPWAANTRLLAEKVETVDEFTHAKKLGYSMFQGYFFSRPRVFSGRVVSPSEIACLDAFQEIRKPEMNVDSVAGIIMRDVSFTYNLLRYINSAAIGLRTRVRSIRQALILLGQQETARWLSLVALRQLGLGKPGEVLVMCIVRGRMGELLAGPAGMKDRGTDMFLLGVFSAIDALLGRPAEEVAMELPLAPDVQAALLGEVNPLSELFRLVMAYERGAWSEVYEIAKKLGVDDSIIPEIYLQAVAWASEFAPSAEAAIQSERQPIRRGSVPVSVGTAA